MGEPAISELDILVATELALPHRLKRQPFQDAQNRLDDLSGRLQETRRKVEESKAPGGSMVEPSSEKKTM
jgi:Mg-chelatase subunit ChlI